MGERKCIAMVGPERLSSRSLVSREDIKMMNVQEAGPSRQARRLSGFCSMNKLILSQKGQVLMGLGEFP